MSEKKLVFWFHFFCPYSYLAWESLKESLKGRKVGMEAKALEFEEIATHLVRDPKNFSDSRWERMCRRGRALGVSLKKLNRDSFTCQALARSTERYPDEKMIPFVDAVFQAIFDSEIDPKDTPVLLDFLKGRGVDPEPLMASLSDPATLETMEENARTWKERSHLLLPQLQFQDECIGGFIDQTAIDKFFSGLPL